MVDSIQNQFSGGSKTRRGTIISNNKEVLVKPLEILVEQITVADQEATAVRLHSHHLLQKCFHAFCDLFRKSNSQKSKKNSWVMRVGMRNLGNTCYINALLQALSNIPIFRMTVLSWETVVANGPPSTVTNKNSKKRKLSTDLSLAPMPVLKRAPTELLFASSQAASTSSTLSLMNELHSIFRILWSGKWATITPYCLISSIWKHVTMFKSYKQQDVHEFYCYFMDRIHEELALINFGKGLGDMFTSVVLTKTTCNSCLKCSVYQTPGQVVVSVSLASTIERVAVKDKTVKLRPNLSRGAAKPSVFGNSGKNLKISLTDLLDDLCISTDLVGASQYKCSNCNCLRDGTRKDSFKTLPSVLVIHINRAVWSNRGREKIKDYVSFPLDSLDLSGYAEQDSSVSSAPKNYKLVSVISHLGRSLDQGHYINASRYYQSTFSENGWVLYNDSKVSFTNQLEVSKMEAYMLFYQLE